MTREPAAVVDVVVAGEGSTVAVAIAATIASAGVTRVFTFPGGGSNLPILEALGRAGVELTLNHSEDGSAFMAAATAELTGVPGVFLVGLGPGIASAVNGAAHAYLDRSPVLLIADKFSAGELETTGHQVLDHAAIFASVTKATLTVHADDAEGQVRDALDLCLKHPQGPVLIEVSRDVVNATTTRNGSPPIRPPTKESSLDAASIRAAALALSRAERPVILVGLEARHCADGQALIALAERLPAPVFTTYKAKGTFPGDSRLAAGILTGASIERQVLSRADLLLAVGVDPVELLARPWPFDVPIIAVRPVETSDTYLEPTQSLDGSMAVNVDAILSHVERPGSLWTLDEIEAAAETILETLRVASASGLSAWQVVETVQTQISDAIVAVDAGAHMFAATWFWKSAGRGRFLISNGLASMGFAVPASIAAALTAPDVPVVAFTGDGGFLLNAAELETAARIGAKVIVIVLNDSSLSLIRVKRDEQQLRDVPLDYLPCDFADLSRALGVRGVRAGSVEELRREIRSALDADQSTVIDVTIDGSAYNELNRLIRG